MKLFLRRGMRRLIPALMVAVCFQAARAYGATFTVTNETELAQAILDANANPGADMVATHPALAAMVRTAIVPVLTIAGWMLTPYGPAAIGFVLAACVTFLVRRKKAAAA